MSTFTNITPPTIFPRFPKRSLQRYAYLKLYLDKSVPESFRKMYQNHIDAHNASLGIGWDVENNECYIDAGTEKFPNSICRK